MTKNCGGHSDLIAGSVCVNSRELYEQLNISMQNLGTGIDGFNAWLAMRSCKTIELRVERAQSNAMAIARFLEAHPKVLHVNYPGLPKHP